jgi:nucleoid-associated protein YgaU
MRSTGARHSVDVMGDTLRTGEQLGHGQSLENGAYRLVLQPDGNLVLEESGAAVWASGTDGSGVTKAVLQPDGNFVLYSDDGNAHWASQTGGRDADRLTLQADRNVVLYGKDGAALWSSGTNVGGGERTHTVEPGETLWVIAERYYGDGRRFHEIAEASGIADADVVNVGQVLNIPK